MELVMKNQILTLMLGVAVLASSPAFAMDQKQDVESQGSRVSQTLKADLPSRFITTNETRFIGQREVSIASAADEKYKLATVGVSFCVAIGIYNPILKRVALAHCDSGTSPKKAMSIFVWRVCEDTDRAQIKISLISQSAEKISRFHSHLKNIGFPEDVFTIIKTFNPSNVGIDSTDGVFFNYDYNDAIHRDAAFAERLQLLALKSRTRDETLKFIK
jgi:hypothetical protein